MIRAETWDTYINKKGGTSYKVEWLQRDFYDKIRNGKNWKYWNGGRYRRIQAVPCGRCQECQLNYSREWAKDCMLEKKYWPENECWFITLTYNDENLPFHTFVNQETGEYIRGTSLKKKDLQDFWKRVRKKYNKKILYINVGEYGTTTHRPHYHIVVFGLPLDESKFKKIGINKEGDPLWTSPELEKLWSKKNKITKKYYPIGNVQIGRMTYKSVAYTVRYSLKKASGRDGTWHMLQGSIPEFISMSQGIAYRYYRDYAKQMIKTDTVPTPIGLKPIPRRFMRILQEQEPEIAQEIKEKRQQAYRTKELQAETDKSPEEQRKTREEIGKAKFKDLRKEM